MDVELYDCVVTHYGYRQAEVVNRIAQFDFNTGDHIDQLRDVLGFHAETGHDNHEVYVATKADGSKICFEFGDWKCYIGTDFTITMKSMSPQRPMGAKSALSSATGSATSAPISALSNFSHSKSD